MEVYHQIISQFQYPLNDECLETIKNIVDNMYLSNFMYIKVNNVIHEISRINKNDKSKENIFKTDEIFQSILNDNNLNENLEKYLKQIYFNIATQLIYMCYTGYNSEPLYNNSYDIFCYISRSKSKFGNNGYLNENLLDFDKYKSVFADKVSFDKTKIYNNERKFTKEALIFLSSFINLYYNKYAKLDNDEYELGIVNEFLNKISTTTKNNNDRDQDRDRDRNIIKNELNNNRQKLVTINNKKHMSSRPIVNGKTYVFTTLADYIYDQLVENYKPRYTFNNIMNIINNTRELAVMIGFAVIKNTNMEEEVEEEIEDEEYELDENYELDDDEL